MAGNWVVPKGVWLAEMWDVLTADHWADRTADSWASRLVPTRAWTSVGSWADRTADQLVVWRGNYSVDTRGAQKGGWRAANWAGRRAGCWASLKDALQADRMAEHLVSPQVEVTVDSMVEQMAVSWVAD
jgi:hypothetical protein